VIALPLALVIGSSQAKKVPDPPKVHPLD